ncbi:hypothetical protein MNEG_4140 [Monoraphidium neglectum]|uniref:Protein MIS12 homolog n=1 Tax=Monoraphidium neglectum TaxID=145388 RepID=A0A0D2MTM6_9CHLO|nr:hypothetical protein MNEG_4140 [Monoraphidium neglectum]KIZ03817.1 hypothetical protein MNEG_4140 [Monoraphidium neglectum]|eukprot:XP_013902836.1 hypothetical protein MNEG_4140 [Monoraphidium neglectum]
MDENPQDMEGVQQQQQNEEQQAKPERVSPFTFQPALVIGDMVNVALETCADAFDRFEEAVAGAAEIRPEHRRALLQGIGVLYECASGSLNQAATNFERLAQATILRVPPELYLEQEAAAPLVEVSPEEEAQLDAELADMRRQIGEAKQDCRGLRQQLKEINRDLALAGDPSAFDPLSGALATQRAALLEDAASIGGALQRLGPMLARAKGALAAREGPGSSLCAKAPNAAEAAAGAQRRMAAAQQDTGASLDQLEALQQSLTGTTQ